MKAWDWLRSEARAEECFVYKPEQDLRSLQQEDIPDPQQVVNGQGIGIQSQEPLAAVHGRKHPFLLHVTCQFRHLQ